MAKDDNAGLLSKVVRFVTNPTTNWSDLDHQEAERESGYSKQMLKEMIERKRRNDFVRKREFDMLRKLRRSEMMAGQDPAARPSFFQSSLPSRPDDRASTLKKIDEIEAQMSMQWWKNKQGDNSRLGSSTNFPVSAHVPPEALSRPGSGADPAAPGTYTRTAPQALVPSGGSGETDPVPLAPMLEFPGPATRTGGAPSTFPPATTGLTFPPSNVHQSTLQMDLMPASGPDSQPSTGFTASKMAAIEVGDLAHDPQVEEASIRFANGDDSGAESGLLEVLAPGGPRVDHEETWLTLFDLYRATGRQDRFEAAALDFAGRFNRSAPQWFTIGDAALRVAVGGTPTGVTTPADWNCPSTLGTQSLAALAAALGRATPPWRLNWAKLANIDEAAAAPLARQFSEWANAKVQLRFIGADTLERVLRSKAPSGDRSVAQSWWLLRLAALRVMHRPDEFELAALDYCVTYEVSPPAWETARCEYKSMHSDGTTVTGDLPLPSGFRDSMSSGLSMGYGDTALTGLPSLPAPSGARVDLSGDIRGDATAALELLNSRIQGADTLYISCARLIRVDFTAAGNLLNWVTSQQSEGRHIEFIDAHRLIGCFFNVIGITEHARVVTRVD